MNVADCGRFSFSSFRFNILSTFPSTCSHNSGDGWNFLYFRLKNFDVSSCSIMMCATMRGRLKCYECLCDCELRESSKYGLGWINTAFVVVHLAFSSLYVSAFSPLLPIFSFLSTRPWLPFSYVCTRFCAYRALCSFVSTLSSPWSILSPALISFFSLHLLSLYPIYLCTALFSVCPTFFTSLPLTLPLHPSAALSSSFLHPSRERRARIYILIYQFPAAVEAVMDGVMLAQRRCHELP